MNRWHASIKDPQHESASFRRRALVGFGLIVLALAALLARFAYLQVARYDEFATRAMDNRVKPVVLAPARGLIYDRNGVLLADNVPAFRLEVMPEQVKDMSATLRELGAVVPLGKDDLDAFHALLKQSRRFDSVPLKMHLTEDEIDRFAVNRWRFPGVDVVPYMIRHYPLGQEFAHVLGYVGRIDADDLKRLDPARYKGTSHIGRIGLERAYEDSLHGKPGYELVEVNADGRTQRVLETHPPTPGNNLYLSIDARLQRATAEAFDGRAGAAVAIDPRNGQVLAMVSVPTFDPNLFVNGISHAAFKALNENPSRPQFNRIVLGGVAPGSTVKPFLGLAGLDSGVRRAEDKILSTGMFYLPGQRRGYGDSHRGGHGWTDLRKSIAQSVNTYYYKLALDMGIDRLDEYMGHYGFGRPTGIDLAGEIGGILPSPAWKAKNAPKQGRWYPGDTVITGIGQGFWNVTPLQLAKATGGIATGWLHVPHLVMDTRARFDAPWTPVPAKPAERMSNSPAHLQAVREGMIETIHGYGTATNIRPGLTYLMAGKTGTAQVVSRRSAAALNPRSLPMHLRHRALFIAFAPADAPRIAVMVVVEHGGSGAAVAAPVALRIVDAWLRRNPG